MKVQVGGFFGLLLLIVDIWAIVNVAGSNSSNVRKVAWIVLIILLPLLGFIAWFFFGPRSGSRRP